MATGTIPAQGPAAPVNAAQAKYATFISRVAAATRLDPSVLTAWTHAEGGPPGNPLNIGPGRNYGDQTAAANATITLLQSPSYAPILRAAQSGSINAQLQAITHSPWDKCRYTGTNPDGTCLAAKPGSLLVGSYYNLFGGIGGAVGGAVRAGLDASIPGVGVADAVGSAIGLPGNATGIPGAIAGFEQWAGSAALRGLLYVVFTVMALGLIVLALARGSKAAPGPAGYARGLFAREPAGEGIPF